MFIRRSLVAGALALLLSASAVTSSSAAADAAVAAKPAAQMRVSGAAAGFLGPEADPVRIELDGRATDPLRPSGTFHVVHRKPDGRLLAEFSGRITSLEAVDEVAVVTGVIDTAEHPEVPLQFVGKPVAITVYDGGDQDRFGWAWGFFHAPVNPRQGPAPFFTPTESSLRVSDGRPGPRGNGPAVDVKTTDGSTTVSATLGGPSPSAPGLTLFALAGRVPAGADPTAVQGRFRLVERGTDIEGRLTCLTGGGPVAMTTGVVTKSKDPAQVGKPVSFSLKDGRIDRAGWLLSWSAGQPPIADCMSTVPYYAPRWGGVVVR